MQRSTFVCGNKRDIDGDGGSRGECFFGIFGFLPDPLQCCGILIQIIMVQSFEIPDNPVYDTLVKVIAAKMIVAGC